MSSETPTIPANLPMPITAPLTPAQRAQLINLVRRAARSEILPRFRTLGRGDIATKRDDQDLVTEADRQAEKMIARGIARNFPHALIIGEEDISANPEKLDKIAEAEMTFTIDPVDGTWNFAHGLGLFGVIISVLRFGRPVFGLLYDPLLDDWIVADKTSPALIMRPQSRAKPVNVSQGGPVETLKGCVPLYTLPERHRAAAAAVFPRFARAVMLRCSCHDFRMLAQGHVDFTLSAALTPWDHAAGALITARAGGHVAMLDGSDYRADLRDGYLLCASDAATWARVAEVFAFLLKNEA